MTTAGYDVNNASDEALAAAKKYLEEWDVNITQFDSDSYKNEVADGTTWLAQAYSGDALQQMEQNPDLGFIFPQGRYHPVDGQHRDPQVFQSKDLAL